MTQTAKEKLKFADAVTNIAASEDNPIKHGIFVRYNARMAEYVTAHGVHRTPIDNLIRKLPEAQSGKAADIPTLHKIAIEMHYPRCWDTMVYPTIYHAIYEMASCSECQQPALQTPKEQPVQVDDKLSSIIEDHLQAAYSGAGVHPDEILKAIRPYLAIQQTANLEKVREALVRTRATFDVPKAKGCFSADYIICVSEALTLINTLLGEKL